MLIGTTVETLTTQSRQVYQIQRWRNKVRNHIVIVGYGTKGRTAAAAMVGDEVAPADIVVVDENPAALERAKSAGLVTVRGSATDSEVLRLASAQHAKAIIVATNRDDSAVLVTLTARELAPKAKIIAAVREAENQHLLEQSGADSTVVTSETAGRLLGIAVQTPSVVEMMEDLLTPDAGFAIAEREVTPKEVGGSPRHLTDIVLGVVRNGKLLRVDDAQVDAAGDSATGCSTSAARTPTDDVRVSAAQCPAAVPRRRRPRRHAAHRHRRRHGRLGRCASCCGWIAATRS